MKAQKILVLASILFIFGSLAVFGQSGAETVSKNYQFTNGKWFDGKKFKKKTFYSVNGVFAEKKPRQIDETIDLKDGYVIPPFGDAHNHTVEMSFNLKSFSEKLFSHGIFYVKNPNSVPRFTKSLAGKINKPNTIDAVFAGGGLTAKGGHPSVLYDQVLATGPFSFAKIKSYNGLAYHLIDKPAELEAKWEKILAGKPDFIKTYLLFSEEFAGRKDKEVGGFKGLDPNILPLIVKKAHASGLRVSTHINTAFDFKMAVRAGVDEINHLPGRFSSMEKDFENYVLKEEDVKLAGQKGIFVVPTYSLLLGNKNMDKTYIAEAQEVQRKNLNLLRKHGIRITYGPDSYNQTSQREAFYLKGLGIFSNLELIKMWAEYTPQTIFPARKIGHLRAGYEASFLVLKENPLENFEAVKDIGMRFKQGQIINIPKE